MTVETMWWISSGAFALLCLLFTLEYAEVASLSVWLYRLRSKAKGSKGWQAILLWMLFALLDLLLFTLLVAATAAALGLFVHLVAVFIAAPLLGVLIKRATERLTVRFQSKTTET